MSKPPTHEIVEARAFTLRLAKLGVSEDERGSIYDTYAANPAFGTVLRRCGGLRKGRIAKDGSGKSGGYRVFSFYADERDPTFLFWIIDKSEDDTLTAVQEATFKSLITELKKELRR
jgi:hypothetical protein